MKNDNNLFYACSLLEYIGRETKNSRKDVVDYMGSDVERIYNYADVFHCEPIEKVADDFITRNNIPQGNYDNVSQAMYNVPDYWDIGKVFERLIEDVAQNEMYPEMISGVFSSWIAERIEDYNTDLYYQPREYIAECYREGRIIEE